MAFENVDVNQLKSALRGCKNSINYSASKEFFNGISSDRYWSCNTRVNLKNSIDILVNNYYKDLEKKIADYEGIADKIAQYQQLKIDNEKLTQTNTTLSSKLWKKETSTEQVYNETTKEFESVTTEKTVKDTTVENQINANKNKIQANKNTMKSLEAQIKSTV